MDGARCFSGWSHPPSAVAPVPGYRTLVAYRDAVADGARGGASFSDMRLDAHQHFWKYSAAEYGWINKSMGVLKRDFLPSDLAVRLAANGFDGSVAVQARQSLEETRWLLELAEENNCVKGVVGWVDLRSAELPAQLEEFSKSKKLVGVRHVVQDEPDDAFLLLPEFQRGIARLAGSGLVYDLLIFPRQFPAAIELVRMFPEQAFVLDHIAKPPIAEGTAAGVLEPWMSGIRALAEFPHVACKLSGMVTEARWKEWTYEDFVPYLDTVFEAFGPARLMIGSDWPVCTLSAEYAATLGIVERYVERLSASERDAVLGENCARVYGI
jgi:L-fucono-1,5-lactonase